MNQAILIRDVKRVEIIDRPMPERKPGEALLKVLYGGICGSSGTTMQALRILTILASPAMSFPQRSLRSTTMTAA